MFKVDEQVEVNCPENEVCTDGIIAMVTDVMEVVIAILV